MQARVFLYPINTTMKRMKSEPAYLFFRLVSKIFEHKEHLPSVAAANVKERKSCRYTEKRNPTVREFMC